mgnify:FL=1|tara:strand:+ start:5272 stop:6297 length:1026 start_codon:yes stop_codon:yes gene_type:complete
MARIQFGTLSIPSCPVDKYMEKFLDSEESPELEIELKSCKNLSLALKKLENGELDLLALPAENLHGKQLEMYNANCEVLGARTPRTPNMILVSENKIQYQPKSAIILSDSKLVRRQLRRARKGLRVLSVIAFAEIYNLDLEFDNELSKYSWMEELRLNGDIDGYAIPRVIYSQIDINERRHSLLPDPNNLGDSHFLPQPYSDLVIIIGRKNFPRSISELFSEVEGDTIWKMQDYFLSSIDEKELEGIGILVRHRKLSTLMTQAEKHKDLIMEQSFHDLEGEVITNEILVEFRIEKISNNGKKTISLQRVIPYSKFQIAMVATEKDWKKILDRAEMNDFVND